MAPKTRRCIVQNYGITHSLHYLPFDPYVSKEWMNFIINEDPDRISKNSALCLLHFTMV